MKRILRTPEACFADLPDYPWPPRYVRIIEADLGHMRMHYVDDGPGNGPVVLLLHGEPSWSFLYRKMIPIFAFAGFRVVAPDLIGFGRSDKPEGVSAYSYARHVDWLDQFLAALDLTDIHLVCQDWGGLLGLRVVARDPDRFRAVVTANTGLPDGTRPLPDAFLRWLDHSQSVPDLDVGQIIQRGTRSILSPDVVAAYAAPFPDASYKAGSRAFPALVPRSESDPEALENQRAWKVLETWRKPWLTAFSDGDPITAGGEKLFQLRIPGARGRVHPTLYGGGHFLQEDVGPQLAQEAIALFRF